MTLKPSSRLVIIAGLLIATPALSQDREPYESVTQSAKLFDEKNVQRIRGTVADIETVKPMADAAPFLSLKLKTSRNTVDVHLGPKWYMDEQAVSLEIRRGTPLEVLGSPARLNGRDVFIASEVRQTEGAKHLRLRHKDGSPVWAASEKGH